MYELFVGTNETVRHIQVSVERGSTVLHSCKVDQTKTDRKTQTTTQTLVTISATEPFHCRTESIYNE